MSELNQDFLATLGELADEPVEQTGPTGDFVYIDISSIDRETKKISDPKPLTLSQAPSRAKQLVKAGDVLVSMTRPNLNAVALVPEHLDGAIGSTGFHVLRSRWLNPRFLLGLVQTQNFIDAMSAVVQGALYPAVRPRDISAYSFSFETPAQQTRIVAKLEELLSDLDAGVAELKAAQKKLGQYRQSLLKAAVEGALTAEWRAQRLTPSPQPLPHQGGGAVAALTSSNTDRADGSDLAPLPPRGGGVGGEGANHLPITNNPWLKQRAKALRREQTPFEQTLWQQLRAKRFSGFKFRRQQVLGRYIIDFVCFEKRLIVEADGGQHNADSSHDGERDAWLEQQGFRVLRVWNNDIAHKLNAVLESIWQALQQEPPLPNPSPARGEGQNAVAREPAEGEPASPLPLDGGGAGGEGETGAQLLERILRERRARWEAKQLAKFSEQGKTPPKDWQKKYPEPVQPDTTDLPELPEGWVWATIDQLAAIGTGVTPLKSKSQYYLNGDIPWVTSGALNDEVVTEATEYVTPSALTECRLELYPAGSLLVAMYGEGKTRGKCSELAIAATINQAIAALVLDGSALACKPYLKSFLLKSYNDMRNQASGGVQPNLNLQIIRSITVPLPPLDEQCTITDALSLQLEAAKDQGSAIDLSLKQSAAQRQNILRAAFSGQLVPQDPNDEPASVLLERIRAERAAAGKQKTTRTPKRKKNVGTHGL